ncbi:hypothetical protein [Photobacterium kishitanii]|uniref:hypothetical protein n=1 Tax=Photobacterium kishitanii TaxID=318456 RepID=UPI0007F86B7A|nr:hypothetical protein [Photobacterium kishitanii]OBU32353.1 hypothetical protein AYY23_04495 [Photobacterium kishitanii]PSW50216.1 hypothetical protein C0W66_04775 [Photobacterium kishitanii]
MVINELVTQLVSLNRLIVHSQHNITNQHISISAHQSTQRLYQSQLQHLLAASSTSPLQYITLIRKQQQHALTLKQLTQKVHQQQRQLKQYQQLKQTAYHWLKQYQQQGHGNSYQQLKTEAALLVISNKVSLQLELP